MPARNDITGDPITTRGNSEQFRSNWDNIFKKKADPIKDPAEPDSNYTNQDPDLKENKQ